MRTAMHGAVVAAAAACVGGYLVGGTAVVLALVLAGVTAVTWQVAAGSGVRIGNQRDAHVVHDEGREGEEVEDLMEAEPPR